MKTIIGIAIVILSIVGFFFNVTPDDLIDAPSRTQSFGFILTLPWYAKLISIAIGVYLIISDSKKTES